MDSVGLALDVALWRLAAMDVERLCRWLGINVIPGSVRRLPWPADSNRTGFTVDTGIDAVAHVELVVAPWADVGLGMIQKRVRLLAAGRSRVLAQHVVVLGDGDAPVQVGDGAHLRMRLGVTLVRTVHPGLVLTSPALAPVACLTRLAGPAERAAILSMALAVINAVPDDRRRAALIDLAAVLGLIRLGPADIEAAGRAVGVPVALPALLTDAAIERRGEVVGQARGETIGRASATAELIEALLRRSHGEDARIAPLAVRLARLPHEEALDAVLAGQSLTNLADSVARQG